MYKTPKHTSKVGEYTIRIFDSWKAAHSSRHFIVITKILPDHTTWQKQHTYPTFEDAMSKISDIEKWAAA